MVFHTNLIFLYFSFTVAAQIVTAIKLEHILYTEGAGTQVRQTILNPSNYYLYNTNYPNSYFFYQDNNVGRPIETSNFSPSNTFQNNNNNQFPQSNAQNEPNTLQIFNSGNFPSTSFEQRPQEQPNQQRPISRPQPTPPRVQNMQPEQPSPVRRPPQNLPSSILQ